MTTINLHITQAVDLTPFGHRGWWWVELDLPAGEVAWPGIATVLVSPEGNVAVMGDSGSETAAFAWCYDFDEYEGEWNAYQLDSDIAWARRVIGTPSATWAA